MTIKKFRAKDPGSALTHFIGMIITVLAAIPLLIKASANPGYTHILSLSVFVLSMILLYSASTIYHTLNISKKVNLRLKKFDHMAIYILIAGTYTPVCLIALRGTSGLALLAIIWSIAIIGIIVTGFWVNCPKWFSSVIYISMGWTCVLAFAQIFKALSGPGFYWLLSGGIIYTIGGIIYALKLPIFNNKHRFFGSHEIFHLFVMGGSMCHFILMYNYIAIMP